MSHGVSFDEAKEAELEREKKSLLFPGKWTSLEKVSGRSGMTKLGQDSESWHLRAQRSPLN